jgi:putative SOS response-associated peptidase YedK
MEPKALEQRFGAVVAEPLVARYNAAPSQALPVILSSDPRRIEMLRWGLAPSWFLKAKRRDGIINVRAETLQEKHTFDADVRQRRCLVLADGFYEWKTATRGAKIPYRIVMKNGSPFAFAGIWESNDVGGVPDVKTFAIITTTPNSALAPIHNRMPVILRPDEERLWLSDDARVPALLKVLQPLDARLLKVYEVSTLVNRAAVDSPELIKPVRDLKKAA